MSLFSLFFDGHKELLEEIKLLDKKHNLNLVRKLETETIKTQFLSTIIEIHFGIFFDKIAADIFYEKKIDNKTPDWTLWISNQQVLCEVLRLNPSNPDQGHLDFTDRFMDAIHEIEIGCILYFEYDESLPRNHIDFADCKTEVQNWLQQNRIHGDRIILQNLIEVEFVEFSPDFETVSLGGGGGGINYDFRRLHSDNSALLTKARKYDEMIEKTELPYIICIYLDFHTWFQKRDLYRILYGSRVEHFENSLFYSHLIKDSLYYSEDLKMKNVSGVLLYEAGEFIYFNNYSNHRLNPQNLMKFLEIQHPHK